MSKTHLTFKWQEKPAKHDYTAAESYLSLLFPDEMVERHAKALRDAPMSQYKSKDLLRASRLSPLGVSNSHVERDRSKIHEGKTLSPILLVRDSPNSKLIIADGYHRLCAVYSLDENANIPCKLV
ncbi:MAG: hypothetical protein ABIP11_05385 [Luteimonas sp.]